MGPITTFLEKDKKYFWCTCGLSLTQPFCDGTHKGTGQKSLPFEVSDSGEGDLCMCKQTKSPPYCDGSHNDC